MARTMMHVLGVASPSMSLVAHQSPGDPSLVKAILPGAGVGIAGAMLWKEHRVLGFLAGDTLGMNAYRLWRGQGSDRTRAVCNMASTGAGIVGSLLWKKHPFYGYLVGFVAGVLATSFVPGSGAHLLRKGE